MRCSDTAFTARSDESGMGRDESGIFRDESAAAWDESAANAAEITVLPERSLSCSPAARSRTPRSRTHCRADHRHWPDGSHGLHVILACRFSTGARFQDPQERASRVCEARGCPCLRGSRIFNPRRTSADPAPEAPIA